MATKLTMKRVEKPWGRRDLGPWFKAVPEGGEPVGEIWFEMPKDVGKDPDLLVKFLFTSEKLSIQVHPNDKEAQMRGLPRGKDEAWVILSAEPDSTIALGLKEEMRSGQLAAAARYGSLEELVDWKPVKAGESIYSAAGTIHAIGAGLTVVEIQQNVDVTYRLYDYGRPRELHLEDGIAVSEPKPWHGSVHPHPIGDGREIAAQGPKLTIEEWHGKGRGTVTPEAGRPVWLVTLSEIEVDGQTAEAGETWYLDSPTEIDAKGGDLILGYPGRQTMEHLWRGA